MFGVNHIMFVLKCVLAGTDPNHRRLYLVLPSGSPRYCPHFVYFSDRFIDDHTGLLCLER
jgi:hypothetical protein